jgi:hypothetical protein
VITLGEPRCAQGGHEQKTDETIERIRAIAERARKRAHEQRPPRPTTHWQQATEERDDEDVGTEDAP